MGSDCISSWSLIVFLLFTLCPDVVLNTKIYKKFSHNGPVTQSMHLSEDTKIKLITMIKQRRVLMAKPKPTASQS